jgi:hypothetical protein
LLLRQFKTLNVCMIVTLGSNHGNSADRILTVKISVIYCSGSQTLFCYQLLTTISKFAALIGSWSDMTPNFSEHLCPSFRKASGTRHVLLWFKIHILVVFILAVVLGCDITSEMEVPWWNLNLGPRIKLLLFSVKVLFVFEIQWTLAIIWHYKRDMFQILGLPTSLSGNMRRDFFQSSLYKDININVILPPFSELLIPVLLVLWNYRQLVSLLFHFRCWYQPWQ